MTQYDVFSHPQKKLLLVDIQADVLDALQSRVVIPLVPVGKATPAMKSLNPVLRVNGEDYLLSTQDMAGVSSKALKRKVATASEHRAAINAAIDFLMHGY
jgi:toxin CcdB